MNCGRQTGKARTNILSETVNRLNNTTTTYGAAYYSIPVYSGSVETLKECFDKCKFRNYNIAGILSGQYCHCGYNIPPNHLKLDLSECDMGCKEDKSLKCGGPLKYSTFLFEAGQNTLAHVTLQFHIAHYN